ncbi:MAG: FecR domain-containing protein [Candidatus Coatesbacteria bacterium]
MVETVVGTVTVEARPGAKKVLATVGMGLPEGAMVTTGRNGRVFIRFGTTDLVRLKEDSQIWIAQLRGWKPTRTSTLLQLVTGTMRAMLNRTGAEKVQNFGIVAGSTVCAVKGTMFDMLAPAPGAIAGKVEVRCDDGGVGVGTVKADDDLATFSVGTAATRVLKAGYSVSASAVTGKIELARRVPPRTTLEVVGGTGRVTAVVAGRTVEVQPGDEVPAGAKVTVTGGSAVLAGTKTAVQAADGTSFAYEAKTQEVKGVGPVVTSVVTVTAGSAVVDAGGRTATLGAGSAAVVNGAGAMTPMTAAQAAAVLNPPAAPIAGKPATAPAAKPAVVEEPAGMGESAYAADEVLPELPALPPTSDVTPPPTTNTQDTQTVTPPGQGEENPISPSQP